METRQGVVVGMKLLLNTFIVHYHLRFTSYQGHEPPLSSSITSKRKYPSSAKKKLHDNNTFPPGWTVGKVKELQSSSALNDQQQFFSDGYLNIEEFRLLTRALFRNDRGKIYHLEEQKLKDVFNVFDTNDDGKIDKEEFGFCWNHWIKIIVRPISAFLIVDVQNDFISGTLNISNCSAQQNGLDVIDPINKLLDTVKFDAIFYSLDWHPSDHVSFIENIGEREIDPSSPVTAENAQTYDTVIFCGSPPQKQRLWPRHCVQDTWGSELHKDLKVLDSAIKVYKGTNPDVDSYSVFWDNKKMTDTTLCAQLRLRNATDIYICGLAYDVCVGATAVDALAIGYRTILLDDCSRGVDLTDIEKTKNTVITNSGVIVNSSQVKAMVEGRDRRPELGYKLAMELKATLNELQEKNSG